MWPEPVERVAAFVRKLGIDGCLEEVRGGVHVGEEPRSIGCRPSQLVATRLFIGGSGVIAVLVPAFADLADSVVARVAGQGELRRVEGAEIERLTGFPAEAVPPFPLGPLAASLVERRVIAEATVYVFAGSATHVLALGSHDLLRALRARVVSVLGESA